METWQEASRGDLLWHLRSIGCYRRIGG